MTDELKEAREWDKLDLHALDMVMTLRVCSEDRYCGAGTLCEPCEENRLMFKAALEEARADERRKVGGGGIALVEQMRKTHLDYHPLEILGIFEKWLVASCGLEGDDD